MSVAREIKILVVAQTVCRESCSGRKFDSRAVTVCGMSSPFLSALFSVFLCCKLRLNFKDFLQ